MMAVTEAFYIFVIFFGVVLVTAVAFGVWLIVSIIRLIFRGMVAAFAPPRRPGQVSAATFSCPRRGCQAINPTSARFCRRCGQELLRQQTAHRHAALW